MAKIIMNNKKIEFRRIFKGNKTVLGKLLTYPEGENPQLEFWRVQLPPNSVGDWHQHLVPEFFYVENGDLYVVNEVNSDYSVNVFKTGDVGLTDVLVPQFIWNPGKTEVIVFAIYFGDEKIKPTKHISYNPPQELLEMLLTKKISKNNTLVNNENDASEII